MSRADIAAMKSRLAASTRSTSVWVFCCPTASPVGSVIVNITVAIAAVIASNIPAMLGFFGRRIQSSRESRFYDPTQPRGKRSTCIPKGGNSEVELESRRSQLGQATTFPEHGDIFEAVIGEPCNSLGAMTGQGFGRDRLGGLLEQRQHRHAVSEIPFA